MRRGLASVTLLALTLSSTPGVAEQSADDRAFAAALETRLGALEIERQNCGRSLGAATENAFDTLDTVQRASRATPQGGQTIGERARVREAQRSLDSAIDGNYDCIKGVETEQASIRATLTDPARLHSENERLRNELRRELLALLSDVRIASTVLNAGTSHDEFGQKMAIVASRLRLIRSQYAIPLNRGDHRSLGAPISDACSALYAAMGDWKQARQAAQEVASSQAAAARAAAWETDFYQRQLRAALLKQADAQRRFGERRGTALALVQTATRLAQAEERTQPAISVKK